MSSDNLTVQYINKNKKVLYFSLHSCFAIFELLVVPVHVRNQWNMTLKYSDVWNLIKELHCNGYIITWILHQIFMYFNKVKLVAS